MTMQDAPNVFLKYFQAGIDLFSLILTAEIFCGPEVSFPMNAFIVGLNIFIIVNHIIMALVLWIRAGNSLANILLGTLLFLPVFALTTNLLLFTDYIQYLFFLFFLTPALMMLFGPILYLYLHLLMGNTGILKKRILFHLAPSLLFFLSGLIMMTDFYDQGQFMEETRKGINPVYNFYNLVVIIHVFTYLLIGWREVKKYSEKIKEFFTNMEELKLNWMRGFLTTFSILIVACFICYALTAFCFPSFLPYVETVIGPLLTACTYLYILFQGFSNQAVFHIKDYQALVSKHSTFNNFVDFKEKPIKQVKYGNSAMEETVLQQLNEKLIHLFEEQKPYLDKELTLSSLAEMLDMNSNQLSQLINRRYDKNFFDFVNEYRVKEAERLLLSKEMAHLKIESIGELAGFKSRSTFFAIFKKINGVTPAKFQSEPIKAEKQ